jgi:SAM-dependent methyltransferase
MSLYRRWDPMFFETVDPTRVRRTEEILKALQIRSRGPIQVLDLGSGPGTLTERVLRGFPKSRVVAVDTDPVLLRVGAEALQRFGRRTAWLLADLRKKGWSSELPMRRFDAAVSSLALHWLEEDEVRTLYRDLRVLLRPGGLVINGDYMPSRPLQGPGKTGKRDRDPVSGRADVQSFKTRWEKWWRAVEEEPSMHDVLRQRRVRMPGKIPPRRTTGPEVPVSLGAHEGALRDAGFRERTVSWQERGFRVLIGA